MSLKKKNMLMSHCEMSYFVNLLEWLQICKKKTSIIN